MSNILQDYVANLNDADRRSIIKSFEQFKLDGFIGESPIRTFAQCLMRSCGVTGSGENITVWMDYLANECYRYYANIYFQESSSASSAEAHDG